MITNLPAVPDYSAPPSVRNRHDPARDDSTRLVKG